MVSEYIKKLLKDKARLKKWKRMTLALSCVVVFCVVYALTLPAITLEGKTICGMEEHTHTEECFQDDELVCGKEEHQHTEDCYEKEEEQPVEEENTQPETTESSDEVETVAQPEESKQDESNEEEQQQESTQVTSADFVLNDHPENIQSITLSYKDSNGNWVNIDTNGNQTIPGNAKIKLNVDYFNINIDQLINADEYSQCITYVVPDLLSNAQTVGIITQDSKEVGKLAVQNGVVSLQFKNEYLKQLKTNENSSLTGDFYVEGDVNLSKLNPNGQVTVTTGDKTYNLDFGPDVFAQYGDLKIEKKLLVNSKVISVNGEDYLSYEIKVTTGNVGCPDVKVVDTFTRNQDLVTYVGVTTNKKDLGGNPNNQEPYETIANGKQHGSIYLGTTSIPQENTKKDNETGSLVWTIGDMSNNETRTLTYFVKLKENEPLNKKGVIENNANVYSKTYPRNSSNAPFNPIISYDMNKNQEGTTIKNEDGSYTINYKLDFTLKSNSNYPLKDFEIMDYLDYSDDHYVDEKIRNYVSYNKESFKVSVQKSNGTKKDLEKNEYKLAWAKGDTNYTTEWDDKSDWNPTRFKITGSEKSPITVDPGDSYYVTYSVTVQPEALAVMKSNSVKISNRYLVNASNAKNVINNWDYLDRVYKDLNVGKYQWDEKTVKEPIAASQEIEMSDDVYDSSFKSDTTDKFTVPAGSYPYIVTVNDTQGVWDATEVKMTDTLSPKNMEYVGYAKVEAFEYKKDSSEYSLAGTKWVKIDGLNTFALSPNQIGWENKDYKYVFTYYAKPVNLENYSKTQVTNTFELNGVVKKGDVSIDISKIQSSKTVEFSGSYNMNVYKSSWYYQEPEPDAQTWKNGELYWVIKVSGTSIKEDTVFKDSVVKNSDKEEDKLSYLHDDSLVGIYKGTSIDDFKTIDDLKTSENFTDVRDSFGELTFTGTDGNYDSLEIPVKNKISLNENEKVFMIVKSEPSVRPTNYRDAFNFSNKVSTKDDGINFMDRSTATKTLYCGGDILKELGQTFKYNKYNKESSRIETIVADKDVNIPAGSESRIYEDGLNETGSGIYASWVFKLNLAGDLSGSYRVLENIPDGMQLAYMRIKWIGAEQKKHRPIESKEINNLDGGWTPKSTVAKDDDNESRTTKYYVKGNQALIELGDFYAGKVTDKYSVDVQVVCKMTDSNVLLGNKEKEFMNTVVLQTQDGNDITSASSPVKMKINNLDKSYIPVTENNKNTNKVNFTIKTNQLGQQLPNNEGSMLKLIDKLSDTLILDTSSIKAVKTGTEESVTINASLGEDNTLEIELPNGKPITITYTATVNAAPNQTVGFSNEAYWKNYSSSGQKVEEKNYSYEAGGTVSGAQNPVLKITKKDKNHLNKLLENASFKMVKCKMNEGDIQETNTSWQGTTDKNGNLELGTGTKLMQYNMIYKVTEEKAPNGYVDEKYSCYIMVVKDDGSEKYNTYKDHKDWYSNVKIQYQSTYELTVTNHKGEITVEKKFLNVAGHDSNPVSGTYKFGLYKDKDALDKPIQTIEITYKTGDLNTNSEKFKDLGLNETYYVYELDNNDHPIKDSGVHVINRLEYITSYSTNNAVQNGAKVTVTNQSRVKQLPSTGSYGTLIYRISGTMLVLASLIILININKKNHLNDKSKNRRKQ